MAEHRVTVRVESYIAEDLEREAKRRRQTVAALVRTFIRDGLARYDAFSDRVLQTQEILQKSQTVMEALVGTHLHLSLEASVRQIPQNPDESEKDYSERLNAIYRKRLRDMKVKGDKIVKKMYEGEI